MPGLPPSYTRKQAKREIAAIERALRSGAAPAPPSGSHVRGCYRVAAQRLGTVYTALKRRHGAPGEPGSVFRKFGLEVNWSVYRPLKPKDIEAEFDPPAKIDVPPSIPADPVEVRRLKDQNTDLRRRVDDAERRAIEAVGRYQSMLGLTAEPLRPQLVMPPHDASQTKGRTVILHLSDVHYGETVLLEEMDGLNKYDSTIAKARLGRFFSKAADLCTKYWKGDPPDEIILCSGGDLISGNIHAELEQTNNPAVPSAVREVGEHIAGGIVMLCNEIKRPIRVYSVPGNHGRMTLKPQSKSRSATSLDLLAMDFCEATCRGARLKDVSFYKAISPDCYFSTYGWHWLLTHGDTMGGRGSGTGFIGPMATIIKGHRKLVDTSWRSAKPVHYVLTAHYHTTGKTTFGWANGSVVSYSEFPRDLRADPEPARQNMLVVHPRHGVIEEKPLYLGAPDEGSLYAGPASVVRPTWADA